MNRGIIYSTRVYIYYKNENIMYEIQCYKASENASRASNKRECRSAKISG